MHVDVWTDQWWSVCVAGACGWVWCGVVCMWTCGQISGGCLDVFLNGFTMFFEVGFVPTSLIFVILTELTGQLPLETVYLHTPSTGVTDMCHLAWLFSGCWGLNLGCVSHSSWCMWLLSFIILAFLPRLPARLCQAVTVTGPGLGAMFIVTLDPVIHAWWLALTEYMNGLNYWA